MELYSKSTGEVIAHLTSSGRMTLDDKIEAVGGEIITDVDDPLWSDDGDNVIIDGVRYCYEELE